MYHSSNLLALVALASVSLANPLPNPQYIFGTTNCDVDGLDVGDKKDPATKVDNPAPQQLDYCTPRGGAGKINKLLFGGSESCADHILQSATSV